MRLVKIGDDWINPDQVERIESHTLGEPVGCTITLASGAVIKIDWPFSLAIRELTREGGNYHHHVPGDARE